MSTQIRHFVLTVDGGIREFTAEQAARVASGNNRMPEFADSRVRYLQLTVNDAVDNEIKVQTAGACIKFDAEGRMAEAGPPGESEQISRFEHDAVVQWALRDLPAVAPIFH